MGSLWALALGIVLALGPVAAIAAGGNAKFAALQACPSVEEEIIDLTVTRLSLPGPRASLLRTSSG